jgi:hypothetical protein
LSFLGFTEKNGTGDEWRLKQPGGMQPEVGFVLRSAASGPSAWVIRWAPMRVEKRNAEKSGAMRRLTEEDGFLPQ